LELDQTGTPGSGRGQYKTFNNAKRRSDPDLVAVDDSRPGGGLTLQFPRPHGVCDNLTYTKSMVPTCISIHAVLPLVIKRTISHNTINMDLSARKALRQDKRK